MKTPTPPANNELVSLETASNWIKDGQVLSVAGPEALLAQLPKGSWIAGTSVYHLTAEGGVHCTDRLLVTRLPAGLGATVATYGCEDIQSILKDAPENGFSFVIMTSGSRTLERFSREARRWEELFTKPLIGWISGVAMEEIGHTTAKVYDGTSGECLEDGAVVLHITLPPEQMASVESVNIFERHQDMLVRFPNTGTVVDECTLNGAPDRISRIIAAQGDPEGRLPLLGDFHGASLNVSFQSVDQATGKVVLYAPVFPDVDYYLAKPPEDYAKAIEDRFISRMSQGIVCSCCCILHFQYGQLEGKQLTKVAGPVSFGEIAHLVHNQTIVVLRVQ